MTLFDVDGALPPDRARRRRRGGGGARRSAASASAARSASTCRPCRRAERQRAAAARRRDAAAAVRADRRQRLRLPPDRPPRARARRSPNWLQADPVGAAARALLRRAERASGIGRTPARRRAGSDRAAGGESRLDGRAGAADRRAGRLAGRSRLHHIRLRCPDQRQA